jgi:predicted transcriptional regulator YdeE
MKANHLDLSSDLVILGVALRTSPERAATDIPLFWQKFLSDGIARSLPAAKPDSPLYAVYCDYESDHRGPYTMVLGVAVEPTTQVPEGRRRVRIPAGAYASFVAKGEPKTALWQTWTHVNNAFEDRERRRFIADFERYAPNPFSATSVEAEVVVGLA